MNINPLPDPKKPRSGKPLTPQPKTDEKQVPEQKKDEETEQPVDEVVNAQEQSQVVNSEEQDNYFDEAPGGDSKPQNINLANQDTHSNIFGKNDDDDEDDDDDDDEPGTDIEIGDDPDETKKKIPVM
jgi:hypothetical protein